MAFIFTLDTSKSMGETIFSLFCLNQVQWMDFRFWFLLSLKMICFSRNTVWLCPFIRLYFFFFLTPPNIFSSFNSGIYGIHTHTCKKDKKKLTIITRHWLCFVISPDFFSLVQGRKQTSFPLPLFFLFGLALLQKSQEKKKNLYFRCVSVHLLLCYQFHILFIVFFFWVCIFSLHSIKN